VPTAAELQIVIEAQDRASQQLQAVGQQVQRLAQQVATAGAAGGRPGGGVLGGLLGSVGQGAQLAAGFLGIQTALEAVHKTVDVLSDSIVGQNSRLEEATTKFRVFTGSAQAAQQIVQALTREADITPFNTDEVIRGGAALISVVHGDQQALMDLMHNAVEPLAALKPQEGIEGAAFAVREALGGDLTSLQRRFEVSTTAIENLQAQGVPALQAIALGLRQVGIDSRLVEALGQSFTGLLSNVTSFGDQVRQRLGAGLFRDLETGLQHVNALIQQYGQQILQYASVVGAALGSLAERIAGALGGAITDLLNVISPGAGDRFAAVWKATDDAIKAVGQSSQQATPQVQQLGAALTLPEAQAALERARGNVDDLNNLLRQTNRPVQQVTRDLGAVGVQAAEVQQQAQRVTNAYNDQLQPLQRQLELLQQNTQLQRVQSELAGIQAQQTRQRLELEIAALRTAAQGATDPNAPDLTPRQRAIALALQERELQVQALDIQEQQRPVVEQLQERIQQLTREREDTLQPLQQALQSYRDQADTLNILRERWQLIQQDIQAAAQTVQNNPIQPKVEDPDSTSAMAKAKEQGEAVAKAWSDSWKQYWKEHGDETWTEVGDSLTTWMLGPGAQVAGKVGSTLGLIFGRIFGGVGRAILRDQLDRMGKDLETILQSPLVGFILQSLLPGVPADASRDLLRKAFVGGQVVARGIDLVNNPPNPRGDTTLPQVNPGVSAAAAQGGTSVTVNVDQGAVQVNGQTDEEATRRAREIAQQKTQELLTALLAGATGTDPGASTTLQGAGRP